ncbi:MAG: hypothetical protein ACRBN8_39005 [Nannocystales bacterium]
MSAAAHEQAAQGEDREAEAHQKQFREEGWSTGSGGCSTYCFDTWSNPSSEHAKEAKKHRVIAEQHRKASEALRKAEERSCVGIPQRDRDVSPFLHVGDISRVERVSEERASGTYEVEFSRVPGLDAQAMQRLLDCHIARNAVVGQEPAGMESCPLVPTGVEASVEPRGTGILVRIEVVGKESAAQVRAAVDNIEGHLRDENAG